MIERLDPVLLARIQFAFTISFHIIFPAFTIGLASWLAVLEWRWLKTGNTVYEENICRNIWHGRGIRRGDVVSVRHELGGLF